MFIGLDSKDYPIGFDDPNALRISLGLVVLTVLYALVGVTVGSFFTSNALATALVIAFPAVVEGALAAVLPGDAGDYLPFAAGQSVLRAEPGVISALEGGLIFGGFAAALVIAGELFFDRRDLG